MVWEKSTYAPPIRLERVVIASLADETFHARLELADADRRHEVDARPSDAIALAVRLDCPIFASSRVLDQAAALPDAADDEEPGAEAGSPPSESIRSHIWPCHPVSSTTATSATPPAGARPTAL